VSRPDGPGAPGRLWSGASPNCWTSGDPAPRRSPSSPGSCGRPRCTRDAAPDRVPVHAGQRAYRVGGKPGRGEPHGLPGSYLNGVYERAPAALRRSRLRLPGVGRDRHQRHQWQAHPAAGRRRAVRRPLRRAAEARAGAGLPGGHADRGPTGCRRGPPGAGQLDPAGLVYTSARSAASATRSSRWTARWGGWCSPSWSPTRSCRPAVATPGRGGAQGAAGGPVDTAPRTAGPG